MINLTPEQHLMKSDTDRMIQMIVDVLPDLFVVNGTRLRFKDQHISPDDFYIDTIDFATEIVPKTGNQNEIYQVRLRNVWWVKKAGTGMMVLNMNYPNFSEHRDFRGIMIIGNDENMLKDDSCVALYDMGFNIASNKVDQNFTSYNRAAIMRRHTIKNIINE